MRAINCINADMSFPDLESPLKYVYDKNPKDGYIRYIYLLTGSQIYRSCEICSIVENQKENNRIYAIGLGPETNPSFIKNVSLRSGGNFVLIADNDNMKKKVIDLMKSSISPFIDGITIQCDINKAEMWPSPCRPLYSRYPQIFFIKSSCLENILISGFNLNEDISMTIPVSKCDDNLGMKQLFSRYVIDDIEMDSLMEFNQERMIWWFDECNTLMGFCNHLKNKCIELSLESGVPSQCTSYIGVNYQSDIDMRINYYRKYLCKCRPIMPPCLNRNHVRSKALESSNNRSYYKYSILPDSNNCDQSGTKISRAYKTPKCNAKKDEMGSLIIITFIFSLLYGLFSFFFSWFQRMFKEASPETLIFNQNADGSWNYFVNIDQQIKSKYGRNVAATVAAVSYIRMAFKYDITEYSLMISKSISFLKNIDKQVDWDDVINNDMANKSIIKDDFANTNSH
ncbi:hypothetical protein TVAG_355120 [Trichomonas vaginalis G3]|uniref:VWFA domain-containing protein n=1 Tax=Trichomonas vaginalis (strain ATCC PRA-98 / G3) TaxID=412133 RepID=A2EFZ7_TRIV3|nr:vault protein inter-alpha-trypsin domain-containing protein [Trichomonas vaginalis G3]EAY08453.1 hypothetical protein TVAG_355120 [Trichomonas vaginalis G3]KAI5518115.1 vault protein inter-alpha-trypsin domain-containing protein [Trichomonas vaginalis G3]|eukprot:XP_001320676.1 hypothetical protein [Trichomonas vaginalis G3]